MIINNRSVS